MNADELYEKMKDALNLFGLSFHAKAHVKVEFGPGEVRFIYEGTVVTYRTED